jgi:ABC-type polysaccharide/polyol phosphate transport system ATPase subunit
MLKVIKLIYQIFKKKIPLVCHDFSFVFPIDHHLFLEESKGNRRVKMNYDDALVVKGLSKVYDLFALENISLRIPKGSIMGFIGQNGAGKSTTIKFISMKLSTLFFSQRNLF